MDTPHALKRPSALRLARAADRLSFVYVDKCSVSQDDNGTVLSVNGENGPRLVYLPTATLCALILGPGTSITQPAAAALAASGCIVMFTGSGMIRSYSSFVTPNRPTDLLLRQAAVVSDPDRRASVARSMFTKRFPGQIDTTNADIQQLQALEGVRMKALYRMHAQRHRIPHWRRNNGMLPKMGPPDAVNVALNHANTALYGVVTCVVILLGLSPGLGVIHTGNRISFVLDIADLYKAEITIPVAFAAKDAVNPGQEVNRALRDNMRLVRLLPRIVDDILELLHMPSPSQDGDDWDVDDIWLWSGNPTPFGAS